MTNAHNLGTIKGSSSAKQIQKCRNDIPKGFSAEDLDLEYDIPTQRSYLLDEEAYSIIDQYFPSKPASSPHDSKKNSEMELRSSCKMGHLNEFKKRQFGKAFLQTRRYYMDLERFELLERLRLRNINAESRKPLIQPKVVRFLP
jgi:hypothetical protein